MTRLPRAPLLVLATSLLLSSCGGDDGGPTTPTPPRPVAAELPPRPFLGGLAPTAQAAEDTVRAVLARLDTPAVLHDALAPAADLPWTTAGACWQAGDGAYQACSDGADWVWTAPSSVTGRTDATGRRGAFADPTVAWTWLATTSRDSVAWTWTRAGENVAWHWSRDQEGARLWLWTWPGVRSVGYRVSAPLTTGWCEEHDWSTAGWVLRRQIAWAGGHGRWLRYDAAGAEIGRDTW